MPSNNGEIICQMAMIQQMYVSMQQIYAIVEKFYFLAGYVLLCSAFLGSVI
jgi:hypothetical protein